MQSRTEIGMKNWTKIVEIAPHFSQGMCQMFITICSSKIKFCPLEYFTLGLFLDLF